MLFTLLFFASSPSHSRLLPHSSSLLPQLIHRPTTKRCCPTMIRKRVALMDRPASSMYMRAEIKRTFLSSSKVVGFAERRRSPRLWRVATNAVRPYWALPSHGQMFLLGKGTSQLIQQSIPLLAGPSLCLVTVMELCIRAMRPIPLNTRTLSYISEEPP